MIKKYKTKSNLQINIFFIFSILLLANCTNEMDNNAPDQSNKPEKVTPVTPKAEYTEIESGEWESIKEDHLPVITVDRKSKKENIKIAVNGEFSLTHYIERIGIMDENKQDLAGQSLKKDQKPVVTLSLDPIPENPKTKVYVKCNLHDLWTKPLNPVEKKIISP